MHMEWISERFSIALVELLPIFLLLDATNKPHITSK